MGGRHGRTLANLASAVEGEGRASLVAADPTGTRTLVDRSSHELRARKRARDAELGTGANDQPVRSSVRWDWKGETTAAAACWRAENNDDDTSPAAPLAAHKFKCRVTMQGRDVFGGMRALMEAGYVKGPLPHYVKDAASLGEGGSIIVDHGSVHTRVNHPSG